MVRGNSSTRTCLRRRMIKLKVRDLLTAAGLQAKGTPGIGSQNGYAPGDFMARSEVVIAAPAGTGIVCSSLLH